MIHNNKHLFRENNSIEYLIYEASHDFFSTPERLLRVVVSFFLVTQVRSPGYPGLLDPWWGVS
jgi:hypothetical protein